MNIKCILCAHIYVYMCTVLMNQIQDFAYSRQKFCMEPVPEKLHSVFNSGGGGGGVCTCL